MWTDGRVDGEHDGGDGEVSVGGFTGVGEDERDPRRKAGY